jgi:hypothetical protein
MKTILLFSLIAAGFYCGGMNPTTEPAVQTKQIAISQTDSIRFALQVQPILEKNCSPCHFTGGKMYEKMPFDDPHTLLNHRQGILKRIKKEEENSILKQFIEENEG